MMAYRVIDVYKDDGAGYNLTMAHTVCVAGCGIYMFLVFGCTGENISLWWDLIRCRGSFYQSIVTPQRRGGRRERERDSGESPLLSPVATNSTRYT